MAVVLLLLTSMLRPAADRRLTVFTPRGSFAVPMYENDLVAITDVIASLAPTALDIGKKKIDLHAGGSTAEFHEGEREARIGRQQLDLGGPVRVKDGALLVPLKCVASLVQGLIHLKADLHENPHRLFIGNSGIRYSAELIHAGETPSLLLSFPDAVSPSVSADGNSLRLSFLHDPLVSNGKDKQSFADKLFNELDYSEHDNAAEILVVANAPLLATFADAGHRITLVAAPAPPKDAVASPPATSTAGAATPASPAALPNTAVQHPAPPPSPRWFVMIDPAHGSGDDGVRMSDTLLEKNIVLAFAKRLRAALESHGINAVLLRESDSDPTAEERAMATNSQRAAVFIALHAGRPGSGVRIFTSALPKVHPEGAFVEWQWAQSPHLEQSRALALALAGEIAEKSIPVRSTSAALPPLNAINAPAVAIELAPATPESIDSITGAAYQESIAGAIVKALLMVRAQQPGSAGR